MLGGEIQDGTELINWGRQVIQIVHAHPQQQLSVLLHELLEAICHHLDLEFEHSALRGLEAGLFEALTANGVDLTPLMAGAEVYGETRDARAL